MRSFSKKEENEELKIEGFKRMVLSLRMMILSHFFAFGGTGVLIGVRMDHSSWGGGPHCCTVDESKS